MKLLGFYTSLIILNFLGDVNAANEMQKVLGVLNALVEGGSENLSGLEMSIEDEIKKNVHNALMGKNECCILFGKVFNLYGKNTPVQGLKDDFEALIALSIIFVIVLGIMLVVDHFAFGYGFFNVMSVSLGLYIFWVLQFFFNNIPSDYK